MMKKYVLALFVGLLALPIQVWAKQIQTEEPNQLTVISYNIRLGVADDGPNSWEFRKAASRRTATWAFMKDKRTGKYFFYVNTHLDHIGVEARIKGLQLVVDTIAQMNKENLPVILTGDFNVKPSDSCLDHLRKQMEDARRSALRTDIRTTYQEYGAVDDAPIDYVFYKGFTTCLRFDVISKQYAGVKYISDHYPVKAVLCY